MVASGAVGVQTRTFARIAAVIRARTGEARKRAMDRGVRFGRPRKLTPFQREEALARLEASETQADVARSYDVDATTIGRLHA